MHEDDPIQAEHDRRARRLLSAHCLATLLADKVPTDVRYLILPATGQLIIDVDQDILDADEHVLMIPEDRFDTPLSVLLDLHATTNEEYHDRHRSYHGSTLLPMISLSSILSAKLDSAEIVDQDAIQLPNPLANDISKLGRLLNSDRETLASICKALTGARPENPTAVGIDPLGLHIRSQFGVIRALFPTECPTEADATTMIESLIERARS